MAPGLAAPHGSLVVGGNAQLSVDNPGHLLHQGCSDDPRSWSEERLGTWLSARGLPAEIGRAFETHLVNGLLGADIQCEDLATMGISDPLHQRRVQVELKQLFASGRCGSGATDVANGGAQDRPPAAPSKEASTTNLSTHNLSVGTSSASRSTCIAATPRPGRRPVSARSSGSQSGRSGGGSQCLPQRPSPYVNAVPQGRRSRPRSAHAVLRQAQDCGLGGNTAARCEARMEGAAAPVPLASPTLPAAAHLDQTLRRPEPPVQPAEPPAKPSQQPSAPTPRLRPLQSRKMPAATAQSTRTGSPSFERFDSDTRCARRILEAGAALGGPVDTCPEDTSDANHPSIPHQAQAQWQQLVADRRQLETQLVAVRQERDALREELQHVLRSSEAHATSSDMKMAELRRERDQLRGELRDCQYRCDAQAEELKVLRHGEESSRRAYHELCQGSAAATGAAYRELASAQARAEDLDRRRRCAEEELMALRAELQWQGRGAGGSIPCSVNTGEAAHHGHSVEACRRHGHESSAARVCGQVASACGDRDADLCRHGEAAGANVTQSPMAVVFGESFAVPAPVMASTVATALHSDLERSGAAAAAPQAQEVDPPRQREAVVAGAAHRLAALRAREGLAAPPPVDEYVLPVGCPATPAYSSSLVLPNAATPPDEVPHVSATSPAQTSETRSASVEQLDELCKEFRLQVRDMVISDQGLRRAKEAKCLPSAAPRPPEDTRVAGDQPVCRSSDEVAVAQTVAGIAAAVVRACGETERVHLT